MVCRKAFSSHQSHQSVSESRTQVLLRSTKAWVISHKQRLCGRLQVTLLWRTARLNPVAGPRRLRAQHQQIPTRLMPYPRSVGGHPKATTRLLRNTRQKGVKVRPNSNVHQNPHCQSSGSPESSTSQDQPCLHKILKRPNKIQRRRPTGQHLRLQDRSTPRAPYKP